MLSPVLKLEPGNWKLVIKKIVDYRRSTSQVISVYSNIFPKLNYYHIIFLINNFYDQLKINMIILSASGFELVYRGSDITVVLVTLVNRGTPNHTAIPAPRQSTKKQSE